MGLYHLSKELETINWEIEQADGELSPELEARLDAAVRSAVNEVDPIAALIRNLKAVASVEREEAAHFAKRKQSHERLRDRIESLVMDVMNKIGVKRLSGRKLNFGIRTAGTPSIKWKGEGDIPAEFRRVTVDVDGTKAQKAWKSGTLPDGFEVSFTDWLWVG